MKKVFIITAIILTSPWFNGQSIKRIKDKHIVGQEKRQVFYQWGDWQPKPNYVFGIQVNYAYAMVWGWLAPSRNRQYKGGSDIRPLSPWGLQNQRYASTLVQQDRTKEIQDRSKNTYEENLKEFYHYTSATSSTDPLYLLYYKDMLKSLDNFDTSSPVPYEWGFTSPQAWERFNNYGIIGECKRKIDVIQDQYHIAKIVDMPRGKRILAYHDCLIEWRKMQKYLAYLNKQGENRLKAEAKLKNYKTKHPDKITKERRDAEIFVDVMTGRL